MKRYLAVAMAAVAVLLVLQLSMEHMFTQRRRETAPTMADAAEPVAETEKEQPEIYALFGVDTQEGDAGRSDCILLLSYEPENSVLRMCSIARDTMVTIPGEGIETKLGHAYAMGGPEKAVETINENFGLRISHYASVNFSQMAEIVDLMGGVEVPLTQAEWNYLGFGSPYLGARRLSGQQALTYCRIRTLDSDDVRTGRQRTLIAAMVQELRSVPRSSFPELLGQGIRMCRTNIPLGDLLRLGKQVISARDGVETVSAALPGDAVSAWGGIRDDGVWYYIYDLEEASAVLGAFFRGEETQSVAGKM